MREAQLSERMMAVFYRIGEELAARMEARLKRMPQGDQSGWFYIVAASTALADGRPTATIKARADPVGVNNPTLGPFPCLRSYTPVAGHRVLVTWVAGDRADGVIMG